ncbi:MAG: thioredoxin family protein, partial [Rhodocyclaceae bacterium]|nr:thioredoxin family protein [Rhodocyclaceae bacterium]
ARVPADAAFDSDTITRNLRLARQWDVRGVPALFLANGKRFRGYIPANRLEAELAAAANEGTGK